MANNQDIKLARLEELLADYQEALTMTRDEKSRNRLQNAITELEETIKQEKTFRGDRDKALLKKRTFDQARAEIEELIEAVQAPGVMHDQDAFDYLLRKYQELTGADNIPRDEAGKSDFEAALAQLKHLGDKIQIELDAVYGNVDARMLNKDKRELEAIEKGIAEKTQRGKNYRALKNKLKDLEADSDFAKKLDDYKNALKELNDKKAAKDAAQTKVNDLQGKIRANEAKLERLKKELADLKAIDPKDLTKEQADRLKALPGEISGLEKYIGKLKSVELVAAEAELSKAQKDVEKAQTDFDTIAGKDEMKDIVSVMGLIEELGITAGDKPLELTDDIESVKKAVNSAHRGEHLTAQKREMQERATMILDKYGVEADTRKGNFVESLDTRVSDILKNYNPAHIQPGFDDRARDEEIDEPEVPGEGDTPPGPGEPPRSSGAPGGAPGTRTSSVGGGFGGGPMFGSGGGSGAPGAPLTPPTPAGTDEMPQPEHEDGNEFHNLLARGEIVERFDGDVDYKTLVDEPGRTKIEDGFVYRVADIGPDGSDPDQREYAQIREPIDWYAKDTTKKIGKALTNLIASLRDMDEDQLKAIWSTLGSNSLDVNLIREAVEKGAIVRAMDHHELMKRVKDIGPKAQIEMLVALTAFSEEDPTRALQAVGSIYSPAKACGLESKLIVGMDDRGKPKVIIPPKAAEEATFGNRYKSQGKGEQRGPQERQPRRDPKKAPKRDRRDQDEMDK